MGQILHHSATTTEAVRRAVQNSQASLKELRYGIDSKTYGIDSKTVASGAAAARCRMHRWDRRSLHAAKSVQAKSASPHRGTEHLVSEAILPSLISDGFSSAINVARDQKLTDIVSNPLLKGGSGWHISRDRKFLRRGFREILVPAFQILGHGNEFNTRTLPHSNEYRVGKIAECSCLA